MRQILAIVLLAFLPLQFSWAAVASYCGHENQPGAGHFGHHEHQHQADASAHAKTNSDTGTESTADASGEKSPGAMDLDCGHCHGGCSATLTLPAGLPGTLATAPPSVNLKEAGAAHAPTRPERPQWLPLA